MEKQKLLKLTNDYIFKRTFGYEGNEEVTRVFLRDILQTDITEIKLDSTPITEKELMDDKVGIMDIKAVLNGNSQCDIEMQVVSKSDIEKRIMFYWSKMYTQTIKQGNSYDNLKKTISVLIADFELENLKGIEKYITKWNIREEEYKSVILTDILEIYIIELPKFLRYVKNKNTKNLNLWVEFIRNPEVIFMNEENDDKTVEETKNAIEKAKKNLEEISNDEHERYLAHLREKHIRDQYAIEKHGYQRGIKEGLDRGRIEKQKEIVRKMLEENINIDIIMSVTGLQQEEIEKIKSEM